MKKIHFLLTSFVLTLLVFSACRKEKTTETSENKMTIEQAELMANTVVETEATMDELDSYVMDNLPHLLTTKEVSAEDCPEITRSEPPGVFPVTITIDFGDGCETSDGRFRSGKIIIEVTEKPFVPGASRTITLVDYHVDSLSIEGTRTWTNNGPNALGQPSFTRTTTGAKVTFPDGSFRAWDATHTLLMTDGYDTPLMRADDEFDITGEGSFTAKNGNTFSSVITIPLHKKHVCPWIVSGMRDITKNGETATLDYGDGSCDKWGTLTLPDGTTKQIKLKKWHL